jgi:hypothetical protein
MQYKLLILMFIFIGIMFIVVNLVKSSQTYPKSEVIYKYIPRTFDEDQNEPVYVSDIFANLFSQPSVWTKGVNTVDSRKQELINKYFISQY